MTPSGPAPSGEGSAGVPPDWPAVLAHLETEVRAAEQTMAPEHAEGVAARGVRVDDWLPPSTRGPVPPDLRERAAGLLQRQLAVAEALVEQITQSQRQRDVAARMSYGPLRPAPSYIDRAL